VKSVEGAPIYLSRLSLLDHGLNICLADDDPNNRYNKVDSIIKELLEKQRRIKPIPLH
jgi:hypothetical protein